MIKDPYIFTVEEDVFLTSLNRPVRLSRIALIREIMRIKDAYKDDKDTYRVMMNCTRILGKMSDEEYNNYEFNYNNELDKMDKM